jgi:hypothetical protein
VYGPLDYLGSSALSRLRRVVELVRDLEPWPEGVAADDELPWPPFDPADDQQIVRHEGNIDPVGAASPRPSPIYGNRRRCRS